MLTARELQELLGLKARLDAWLGQVRQDVPFFGVDDPRYEELATVAGGWDFLEEAEGLIVVLRSEYIEQLLAQQGSDPLVRKLWFVDSMVSNPSPR
jgi:hypothetical protein